MAAYKSIVFKAVLEIDGVEILMCTCDYTDSINEKIDCGFMPHLDQEVIDYVSVDWG